MPIPNTWTIPPHCHHLLVTTSSFSKSVSLFLFPISLLISVKTWFPGTSLNCTLPISIPSCFFFSHGERMGRGFLKVKCHFLCLQGPPLWGMGKAVWILQVQGQNSVSAPVPYDSEKLFHLSEPQFLQLWDVGLILSILQITTTATISILQVTCILRIHLLGTRVVGDLPGHKFRWWMFGTTSKIICTPAS